MINFTNFTELFCKHPFGKVLQGIIVTVLLLMFFEQYTDTFKLTRLKSAAEVIQKTENNSAKIAISKQIQNKLHKVLNPEYVSLWWERIAGGWLPLFLVALLWWKSDKLAVLRLDINGLLFAILLALLPDFLPSILHCMAVSMCLLLILIAIAVYNLHNPPKKELNDIST